MSSEVVLGLFFDRLVVGRAQLWLRPLGRRHLRLCRSEVAAVEFERQWIPPVWVRSVIRFRFADDTYAPKVMIPLRTRSIRRALAATGWPVLQVQFGSTEPRKVRPLREHLREQADCEP